MSKARQLSLDNAVALVTGAGNGIGLATARKLADRGCRLILIDVDKSALDAAVSAVGADRAEGVIADVRDLAQMRAAVDRGLARFGRLDVALANAGVTPPPATLRQIDPDAFGRVIDVNLIGAFNTIKAAVDPIISSGGHIEIVASCAAFSPGMGGSAYMISKSAVEQLGRALRIELSVHEATTGLVYFGIVETGLARATLDDDPLGREIGEQLPWPLNRRISTDTASAAIVDAIVRRKANVVAPKTWITYSLLRGVINPVLDARLTRDRSIHDILRTLESRRQEQR